MGLRNYITFQRLIGTLTIMEYFFSQIKGGCRSNKRSPWALWGYSCDAHAWWIPVHITPQKRRQTFTLPDMNPVDSCDSRASFVSTLWIHPIITRPSWQSLTLIFGLTSSDVPHHHKVTWQCGLLDKPGYHLWAGLSCLGWGQWDGPWLARPLVLLAVVISPSTTSLRKSWWLPCPDT